MREPSATGAGGGLSARRACDAAARLAQGEDGGAVAFLCPRGRTAALADWLLAQGAERVSVATLEQVLISTANA